MDEYKQSYLILWQAITRAVKELEELNFGNAKSLLLQAQVDAEEAYISQSEANKS